jgi:hypothetical protein
MLTQVDIEQQIMDTSDALEALVDEYADIAEEAGTAEAEFKKQQALMTLAVIEHPPKDGDGRPVKLDAKARDARIELACNDDRKAWAIAAARRETAREAMSTHRTRIDALRTLAANVRALT